MTRHSHRHLSRGGKVLGGALACLLVGAVQAGGATPAAAAATTITVYAGGNNDQGNVFTNILGANHRYTFDGYSTFDESTGQVKPDVVAKSEQMGIKVLRWPGGTVGNTVWWKGTIGDSRMCQRDGRIANDGGNLSNPADDVLSARDPAYGLDEHMTFVEQIGAEAQIMVPMAIGNPADAADLVEYLNTPAGDGINPNGGTDWAEERAANGHPAPYGVIRFELGNENYHAGQRYWMPQNNSAASPPARAAINTYINGGTRRITGEHLGKLRAADGTCTGSTGSGMTSDGTAGQKFEINYPSAEVGTFDLRVNGVTWTQVDDLSTAASGAKVYELHPHIGQVEFGDGVHGAIPPDKAAVVADYTSTHNGFVDFYSKMKAVDSSIKVCAAWGKTEFPPLFKDLAPAGSKYDCLTMHPYTNFKGDKIDDWDSALEAHDWHMIMAWQERQSVVDLRNAVNANTATPHPYVGISEYGALWGPSQNNPFPEYNHAMTHALYMANQWIHWLELGIPWAEGNDFASNGWYTLLGPESSGFVYSAEAVTREAVKPMFEARGQRLKHDVANNPYRDPADSVMCDGGAPSTCSNKYHKLNITATRGPAGAVYLMVVNRSPFASDSLPIDVAIKGFTGNGTASVRQVAPASYTSHNDVETPNAVTLSTFDRSVGTGGFNATLPPYSVTLFKLSPA